MIPKMILEPRLNLDTKLSFEPMFCRPYQACTPRASLRSLENEIKRIQRHVGQVEPECVDFRTYQTCTPRDDLQMLYLIKGRLKPDKIESKHNLMAWRAARNFRARPFRPRLNLHTKLSFEPMFCRPYQACTPRASLRSLENEIKRIQRHVGQVEPGYVDFRPYKTCRPRDDMRSLENETKRIQRHVGGLSRLLTSGARKRGHAKGEEILQKIYSRPRKMILQPRLNLHTKLSFEPMIFRQYKVYMPRTSLQSVENERDKDK